MASDAPDALVLNEVSRSFGNVKALQRATLRLRAGTVHALLGENGAGKTTLMRVAFGLVQPDEGSIIVNGVSRRLTSPADALAAGIGMVHQHFTLVPAMTVAENVALGSHGRFSKREWAARVTDIGNRTGLTLNPDARIADLPVGAQQRCEVVKALARNVRILILDEPTAVLAPAEAQELLKWIRTFADAGNAVVLITHKLRDALSVADEVTVIRRGVTVMSAPAGDVSESALAAAMLGSATDKQREKRDQHGAISTRANAVTLDSGAGASESDDETTADNVGSALAVSGVSIDNVPSAMEFSSLQTHQGNSVNQRAHPATVLHALNVTYRSWNGAISVRDVSLSVTQGEMVGIAAIEGSGQHDLLRILAGRLRPTAGTVQIPDSVGFVPEDRHVDALMLDEPLLDNVALLNAGQRQGNMPWTKLHETTRHIISLRDVRASSERVQARTLSGGNQQKLIVGRELANNPPALVVENPTRGLDFQATRSVHDALRSARDNGTAIVLYSSDLDEVLELSDRVLVMHEGRVVTVESDRDIVGRAMLGS